MATPTPYVLHKPLPNGLFLVRRTTDGELLIGQPLEGDFPHISSTRTRDENAKLLQLITLGAARPAANLLNHENIVSIYDEWISIPLQAVSGATAAEKAEPQPQRMFLWDFCDAGTLQGVFDDYGPNEKGNAAFDPVAAGGFLPESFVWHVALGLLRALQWLHEGVRDTYGVSAAGGGRCKRMRGKSTAEEDWMPVLHRDLRAENVYLQQPRGVETYGAVKLGNFEKCWVSGSVSRTKETPVVAMKWEDEGGLGVLRERTGLWKRDKLKLEKAHRPYTPGCELFGVGALLYRMMVGRPLPPTEECDECGCDHITSSDSKGHTACIHDCVADVNIDEVFRSLSIYTAKLKELVTLLLRLYRHDEWRASNVLDKAWEGFEHWAASTEDGRLYRDIFDDIWFRRQNQTRLNKRLRDPEEAADVTGLETDFLVV